MDVLKNDFMIRFDDFVSTSGLYGLYKSVKFQAERMIDK